jgi:hypothetical protein
MLCPQMKTAATAVRCCRQSPLNKASNCHITALHTACVLCDMWISVCTSHSYIGPHSLQHETIGICFLIMECAFRRKVPFLVDTMPGLSSTSSFSNKQQRHHHGGGDDLGLLRLLLGAIGALARVVLAHRSLCRDARCKIHMVHSYATRIHAESCNHQMM